MAFGREISFSAKCYRQQSLMRHRTHLRGKDAVSVVIPTPPGPMAHQSWRLKSKGKERQDKGRLTALGDLSEPCPPRHSTSSSVRWRRTGTFFPGDCEGQIKVRGCLSPFGLRSQDTIQSARAWTLPSNSEADKTQCCLSLLSWMTGREQMASDVPRAGVGGNFPWLAPPRGL